MAKNSIFFRFSWLLILCFLYIFGPVINSIGSWLDFIFLVSFSLSAYWIIFRPSAIPNYFLVFAILLPLFLFALVNISLSYGFSPSAAFNLIFKPVRILVTLMGGYMLTMMIQHFYKELFVEKLIELIFYSIGLHAIIMIIQFFNVEFKDFVYGYTTTGEFTSFEYNFRMGGLSGAAGGSILSVVQSLGIILMPFLGKASVVNKVIRTITAAVILGSVLICGRSGVLNILLFLPAAYFSVNSFFNIRLLMRFGIILFIFTILFLGILAYINTLPSDDPLSLVLNRTLDTYINFQESGVIKDETTSELLGKHVMFPNELSIALLGQPENLINFGEKRTLNSDMGYIRDIWSFGYIGALLYVFPLLIVLAKNLLKRSEIRIKGCLTIACLIMLFFHFKEPYLYVRMLFSFFALIVAMDHLVKVNTITVNKKTLINTTN